MNIEDAAEAAITFLKKMGFASIQVTKIARAGDTYQLVVDVGVARYRYANVSVDATTGEILSHEVED